MGGGGGDHKGAAMKILEADFWCTFWLGVYSGLEFGGIMGWAHLQPEWTLCQFSKVVTATCPPIGSGPAFQDTILKKLIIHPYTERSPKLAPMVPS